MQSSLTCTCFDVAANKNPHNFLGRARDTGKLKKQGNFWLPRKRKKCATKFKGCVRLGNPDLDFQNLNPDFPIERGIRKRISPPRIPSSWWISIKKSKSGFHGFPFYRSIGKSEKGFEKLCLRTAVLHAHAYLAKRRPLFTRIVSQILFRISQSKKKKKKIHEIRIWIS